MRTNLTLLVLAILLAPVTWVTLERQSEDFTDYAEIPLLFSGFVEENVASIVISQPGRRPPAAGEAEASAQDELVLQRSPDGWTIANTPLAGIDARPAEVRRAVLAPLASIRRDEKALILPDASDEQLAEFGLDEASAKRIRVYDSVDRRNPIADLLVGDSSNSGGVDGEDRARGYYVRRADQRDVVFYEVDSWILSADPNRLADRSVLSFRTDQATRVELKNRTGLVVLERPAEGEGSWSAVSVADDDGNSIRDDVGPVRQPIVTELLGQLSRLQVARFLQPLQPEDRDRYGLTAEDSIVIARVTLGDGAQRVLQIGAKLPSTNERYAATGGSPLLLSVGDWVVDSLSRDLRDMFDPAGGGPMRGGISDRPPSAGDDPTGRDATGRDGASDGSTSGGDEAGGADPGSGEPGRDGTPPPDPDPDEPAPTDPGPSDPGGGRPNGSGAGTDQPDPPGRDGR